MGNPVIECLMQHRSVRKFKPDPIDNEILDLILRAGTRAATAGNLQLYSFVVIDDPVKKKTLNQLWKNPALDLAQAPCIIIALADLHRVRRWLKHHSENPIHSGRPIGFFLALWDTYISLQNMVVAAESLGLGTCYFGSVLELDIQKFLGAPEYVFPAGLVCLGYPETISDLSMRLPMEAVVHRNKYHMITDDEIERYYHERDAVWERVPEKRKEMLARQNIHGIAQALAVQRFSDEVTDNRSRGILRNINQAKFDLTGKDND